jgi:hypothetical protein
MVETVNTATNNVQLVCHTDRLTAAPCLVLVVLLRGRSGLIKGRYEQILQYLSFHLLETEAQVSAFRRADLPARNDCPQDAQDPHHLRFSDPW